MNAKSDALSLLMRARDEWAAGDDDHALELLDAASVRLEQSGFTRKDMPATFDLIARIRGHLIGEPAQ